MHKTFLFIMSAAAAVVGVLVTRKNEMENAQTAQTINNMPPYARQQAAWVYQRMSR